MNKRSEFALNGRMDGRGGRGEGKKEKKEKRLK